MSADTRTYFFPDVISEMRQIIADFDGNEVFFAGMLNDDGIVCSVSDAAHGNDRSVPVQMDESRKCDVLIHNHPGGNLTPSQADIAVAENASENAQGFFIVNNDVSQVYVVVEPVKRKNLKQIDVQSAGEYLADGGPLSVMSENFEERGVQIELLQKIAAAFNRNGIGVFEAGTGVGKSYAYLIPALIWASQNQQRVIISTGTINLQQQLCEKDIPAAEKIVGTNVKFLLMKGRQNYVCRRRFEDAGAQRELFGEDTEIFDKLREWLQTTPSGSRSDLSFMPPDSVWSRINSESDACMGMRCPYHTDCFVMKVRKEALGANLIVVNHHLLFADIESRLHSGSYDDAAVLPPYRRVIFDEAHGIESAATSFFSETFNKFKVLKQMNQLYRKRRNSETGYLCTLAILSSNEEIAAEAYEMVSRIKSDIANLEVAALDLLQAEYTMRLCDKTARAFGPVITLSTTLAGSLGKFIALSREIMEGIADEDKEIPAFWESKVLLRRLEDVSVVLRDFSVWDEKRDLVFWIQKKMMSSESVRESGSPFFVTFTETPLDIAPLMNSGVFEPMESVVCTSATLKTGRDFSYWMKRTGISYADTERVQCGEFVSPFPYKKNMLFAVPNDAPLPDSAGFQAWIEAAVVKLIEAACGRTLVLFTSYDSLKSSYAAASRALKNSDYPLLCQGSDDNARLLELFRKDVPSVLFATDSFWQGVDVPGESLSQVIIVKLPFTVPNDPVFTARAESIESRGGSSFMELSLPEAVIKFRQGAGRLMRRGSDRGCVVVFDRRLYEKRYGSIFMSCIPECRRIYEPVEKIADAVSSFIFN